MHNQVDPVVVSVIQHRLLAIVEEMGEAMLRTSYSQILNSSRDFSTAICGLDGRLIAQAEHVPIHVGALPYAARAVTERFADDIHPGDVFLLNDPYHGGNHLPDLTAFVPVFQDNRPRFWSINRAHQSDIGGATHGAYNAAATDIWQEGIRITPLRLYDGGKVRQDLLEMIATNVRHPRDFRGDLAAMIGSAHIGERRLLALADEFGWPIADAAIEAVLDGAERRARAVIAEWKDGVYHGEALLDDDGRGHDDIHIRATVEKRGSDLVIDLSDSHPEVASFINSSYPNMRSAVVVALSYLIDPDTPKNDGAFRPVTVIARQGTVVWANPGMPVTLATNHCGQEIMEAIVKALAPACPDRAMAGWGRRFRIAVQGKDPRSDRPFIWHFFQARPGGGASPMGDGWPGAGEWQAAGGIKFGSLEVTEARFPAVLPPPRVPRRFGRRGAIPRRPRRDRRDGRRNRGAGNRQHRRRRRAPRRLRHPRRRRRHAAPLHALFAGRAAAPDQDQGGRPRHPPRRRARPRIRRRRRLGRPRPPRPRRDLRRYRERVRHEIARRDLSLRPNRSRLISPTAAGSRPSNPRHGRSGRACRCRGCGCRSTSDRTIYRHTAHPRSRPPGCRSPRRAR